MNFKTSLQVNVSNKGHEIHPGNFDPCFNLYQFSAEEFIDLILWV